MDQNRKRERVGGIHLCIFIERPQTTLFASTQVPVRHPSRSHTWVDAVTSRLCLGAQGRSADILSSLSEDANPTDQRGVRVGTYGLRQDTAHCLTVANESVDRLSIATVPCKSQIETCGLD